MKNKPQLAQNHFDIEIGTHLQIQVGQSAARMESTHVGTRHNKYLIITMPKSLYQSASRLQEDGTRLVIRYIHNGNAYGFKSAVLDVISSPEKLFVITYPTNIEVYKLRNYPRLSCFLPARVFIGNQVIEGSVVDISRTGVEFTYPATKNIAQITEHVDELLQLDLQIPGSEGYTHIGGNLRNVHAGGDKIELGIRFDQIDTSQLTNLLSFLLDARALPEYQNLSGIIQKHYLWREKVFKFIHADNDIEQNFALSPDECDMGKWLLKEGEALYGGTAELQELDRVHRDLHQQVEQAINQRVNGEKDSSIELFNKLNIERISHRMAALLITADENKNQSDESAAEAISEQVVDPLG
jgi:hypothetical protein